MKKAFFYHCILFLMFVGFPQSVLGEESSSYVPQAKAKILERTLIPTGYGLTKFLNKDYYLARFSIDESVGYASADDLAYIDAARRMEFKFVSDKLSGRTFWRRLSQGMKINNEREALKDNIVFVKRLKTFFRRTIRKGDTIRFDYHHDFGTRVYHNKRFLGEISGSREFYRFIANVWFGNRPPSNRFKDGLLGRNGDEYAINMQQRFNTE